MKNVAIPKINAIPARMSTGLYITAVVSGSIVWFMAVPLYWLWASVRPEANPGVPTDPQPQPHGAGGQIHAGKPNPHPGHSTDVGCSSGQLGQAVEGGQVDDDVGNPHQAQVLRVAGTHENPVEHEHVSRKRLRDG